MTEQGQHSLVSGSLAVFLERLGSRSPEPGGGSVSALAGALGAALVSMVASLTVGSERFRSVDAEMKATIESAERLRGRLEQLVDEDAAAYRRVVDALRSTRSTDEEADERERALQGALKEAVEVPLEVAELAVTVGELSLTVAHRGNPQAISDAGVAGLLSEVAVRGACLNIQLNLAGIRDAAFAKAADARAATALEAAAGVRRRILGVTTVKLQSAAKVC